ncbi:hypothetical protein L218DRAFT_961043 [Marasmius fiardii PR-910]|nr:hypothetical protein L218DRAFT_961043 [Marasmius fiardii PR-910]
MPQKPSRQMHGPPKKAGMKFTPEEDTLLRRFVESMTTEQGIVQVKSSLFQILVENKSGKWPWGKTRSADGWARRYRRLKNPQDRKVTRSTSPEASPPLPAITKPEPEPAVPADKDSKRGVKRRNSHNLGKRKRGKVEDVHAVTTSQSRSPTPSASTHFLGPRLTLDQIIANAVKEELNLEKQKRERVEDVASQPTPFASACVLGLQMSLGQAIANAVKGDLPDGISWCETSSDEEDEDEDESIPQSAPQSTHSESSFSPPSLIETHIKGTFPPERGWNRAPEVCHRNRRDAALLMKSATEFVDSSSGLSTERITEGVGVGTQAESEARTDASDHPRWQRKKGGFFSRKMELGEGRNWR